MLCKHSFKILLSCPTFLSKEQHADPVENRLRIYIIPSHGQQNSQQETKQADLLFMSLVERFQLFL